MDLSPYLDTLRRELIASAAPGGTDVRHAAELLTGSLDAAARLTLLELLSDAAAEITTRLGTASVDVRLRGRDADFQVTELSPPEEAPVAPVAPPVVDGGDLARITLRLAEPIKEQVERVAAAEGISVNAWLVRAVLFALPRDRSTPPNPPGPPNPPRAPGRGRSSGKRITGFAQA
jgi:hypothetical protein